MKPYKYIALLAGLHQIDLRNIASSALILCLVLFDIHIRGRPFDNSEYSCCQFISDNIQYGHIRFAFRQSATVIFV